METLLKILRDETMTERAAPAENLPRVGFTPHPGQLFSSALFSSALSFLLSSFLLSAARAGDSPQRALPASHRRAPRRGKRGLRGRSLHAHTNTRPPASRTTARGEGERKGTERQGVEPSRELAPPLSPQGRAGRVGGAPRAPQLARAPRSGRRFCSFSRSQGGGASARARARAP